MEQISSEFGTITNVRAGLTEEFIDDLLWELAQLHAAIPRLRAEADVQYPPNHPMLDYLFRYYGRVQVVNEKTTDALYQLKEYWDKTSIKGKLAYQTKQERLNYLTEDLALYDAQAARKIAGSRKRL